MSMKKVLISLVVFMMVFLNGCTAPAVDNTAELEKVKEENLVLQEKVTDLEEKLGANPNQTANQTAILLAMDVIQALQANDMQALETYAHPQNGIRFSPYSFVDQTNDIVIPTKLYRIYYNNEANFEKCFEYENILNVDYKNDRLENHEIECNSIKII